jgi:plastocyanin
MFRRSALIIVATVALLGLAVGVTLAVRPDTEAREIVLTARGMSFYLDHVTGPNPTIRLLPGEHVRFVLRNEAAGLAHDLSIPGLNLQMGPVPTGASRAVLVRVPATPASFPYVCRPHAQMMRGDVIVSSH